MEVYTLLREFADSWFLVVMFGFFAGAVLWSWRPGAARAQSEAAQVPFAHDDIPASPKGLKS